MESRIRGKFYPSRVLLVELPLTEIAEIFRGQELIRFIEVHRQPKEETHINGYDRTANGLNSMKAFFPALNGSGITISVKERRWYELSGQIKKNRVTAGFIQPDMQGDLHTGLKSPDGIVFIGPYFAVCKNNDFGANGVPVIFRSPERNLYKAFVPFIIAVVFIY